MKANGPPARRSSSTTTSELGIAHAWHGVGAWRSMAAESARLRQGRSHGKAGRLAKCRTRDCARSRNATRTTPAVPFRQSLRNLRPLGAGGGGDWKHHSLDISHLRCISQKCTPHVPHLIDLRLFFEAASPQHSHALSTRLNSIEHALSAEDLKSCCRVGSRAKATCPRLLTTCGWL